MHDFPLADRVIAKVLQHGAQVYPDSPFLFHRDETVSYGQLDQITNQLAYGLRKWGVTRGSRVAIILDNCPRYVFTFFALARLGALSVPINTAARGELLRYYLTDSDCTHVVIQDTYLAVLDDAWPGCNLPLLHVRSDSNGTPTRGPGWDDVFTDGEAARNKSLDVQTNAWDPWLILYTSGTTGPSKGSVCPQAQSLSIGRTQARRMELDRPDRLYTCLPLFHGNALNYSTMTALWAGSAIALETRFSASRFWSDIHRYQCTQFNAMMIVTSILEKLPVTPEERTNPVRIAAIVPPPANRRELEERWGLKIITQYALSEACQVAILGPGEAYNKPRTSGRISENLDVRIVDENDVEVPRGTAGEIVLRPREPWTILTEYYGKPEATARAFRNLWFHTGDRAYIDGDGYLFFVDRVKDAIRRRGENISAFEIEMILQAHPKVVEAAAVPVPAELGEDEVAVYIVRNDPGLTEAALIDYAIDSLAYYMVPRYVKFVDSLPKTPSQKVSKVSLREKAKNEYRAMWDRDAAGIKVDRFTAQNRRIGGSSSRN